MVSCNTFNYHWLPGFKHYDDMSLLFSSLYGRNVIAELFHLSASILSYISDHRVFVIVFFGLQIELIEESLPAEFYRQEHQPEKTDLHISFLQGLIFDAVRSAFPADPAASPAKGSDPPESHLSRW